MGYSAAGKGDDSRPFSVPRSVYEENYERTFGKKRRKSEPDPEYVKLLESGMFFEFYPELTGDWVDDREAWQNRHADRMDYVTYDEDGNSIDYAP